MYREVFLYIFFIRVFIAILRGNGTYLKRIYKSSASSRPFPVSTFVGGFPFASGSFNDGSGSYIGKDSDGGIIMLDLWKRDDKRTNSNITVVGTSGTGKSTSIKHIISSEYARGTKIIVIDPEGEYRDLCRNPLINGDCIDVAGGSGGLINPLQIRPVAAEDGGRLDISAICLFCVYVGESC